MVCHSLLQWTTFCLEQTARRGIRLDSPAANPSESRPPPLRPTPYSSLPAPQRIPACGKRRDMERLTKVRGSQLPRRGQEALHGSTHTAECQNLLFSACSAPVVTESTWEGRPVSPRRWKPPCKKFNQKNLY